MIERTVRWFDVGFGDCSILVVDGEFVAPLRCRFLGTIAATDDNAVRSFESARVEIKFLAADVAFLHVHQ